MKVWVHLDNERYCVETTQWELGEFFNYNEFNKRHKRGLADGNMQSYVADIAFYQEATNKGIRVVLAKIFEVTEGEANVEITRRNYVEKARAFLQSQISKGGLDRDFQFQIVCDEVNNSQESIKDGILKAHCIWQYYPGDTRHRCIISNAEVIC